MGTAFAFAGVYEILKRNKKLSIILGCIALILFGIGSIQFFLPKTPNTSANTTPVSNTPKPIYSPTSEAPLFTANFKDNSQGWNLGSDWQLSDGNLSSIASHDASIIVPFHNNHDSDYALEVSLQMRYNNSGKAGFGIVIHSDEKPNDGYQGAIFPPDILVKVHGQPSGSDQDCSFENCSFQLDPVRFIRYKLAVHKSFVLFYADDKLMLRAPANKYPDPGVAVVWVTGGATISINELNIMAS